MYLGGYRRTVKAVDDGSIRAVSRRAEAKAEATTIVAPVEVVAPVVVDRTAEVIELRTQLEALEAKAKEDAAHQRGRVRSLLTLARSNKREIARLKKELAAHTDADKLTVDQILESQATVSTR